MGATERIVRHLRLRAGSEASVRRAVVTMEDALRCASLPDAGARVLLVRCLDLGRIAADVTPQTLSRLIEQKFASAGGTWLHAGAAPADSADFVYFHDALEARYVLALRLARASLCTAWYWPLAVPEFKPMADAQTNLRGIALALAALPEAPAALPAWIARLTAAGVAPAIARAMAPVDAAMLLQAAHLQLATSAPLTTNAASRPPVVFTPGAPVAQQTDLPSQQARAINPALPAWLRTLALAGGFDASTETVSRHTRPGLADSDDTNIRRRPTPLAESAGPPPPRVTPAPASATLRSDTLLQAAASNYGGLLFLLPVLHRLEFAAWAETLPEGAAARIARKLLALVLERLQAPPDDPAWLLAGATYSDKVETIEALAPARLWLAACRRWLRRQARIGVANLVTRPAMLALNVTHADVHFSLNATDMRVRRAGLDFDPGWVWWYGRVVSFHYAEQFNSLARPRAQGSADGR